jgi:hypothetical protein
MNRKWMPIVAGIYDITSGLFQLVVATIIFIYARLSEVGIIYAETYFGITALTLSALLAIIGGIYITMRTRWHLALIGSIAASIPFIPWFVVVRLYFPPQSLFLMLPGIAATVLTVLSKREFK